MTDRRVLTVRQLNEAIKAAMQEAFPDPVWVKGEVQRLPGDAARRNHVYFELHEAGENGAARYQIPTAILQWDRSRFGLGRFLDGSDPAFQLQNELEVCLLCRIDFYPPFGKTSLKVVGIDPEFSLGQLEAQRRRVLAWLEQEGLLRLNAARPLPDLPLRVGLITSRGSAAEQDFRTGLEASGYDFGVLLADCRVQGEQAAPQIIAALKHLAPQDLDVVVITRGGGSRADLSWFDQAPLCEAVARCPLPVVTAIGHEIDTSLVDLCAHTRGKTPTAAAELLVERVREQDRRLEEAARRLQDLAARRLREAEQRLEVIRRVAPAIESWRDRSHHRLHSLSTGLALHTGPLVDRHQRRLQGAASRVTARVERRVAAARDKAGYLAGRVAREALRAADAPRPRLDLLGEKVRLLDPARLLERGFTLTLDARGRVLRRAADAAPGRTLRTRFADGEVTSVETRPRRTRKRKGETGGGEEDSGQQALF